MSAQSLLSLQYLPSQIEIFFDPDQDWKYKIVRKGRRAGITRGATSAFIEYCLDGVSPLLWVDTINGNIDRYFERYFLPVLKQLPSRIPYRFNQQKRELKINNSIIDFRSADIPENIEGFGYQVIFLNEAGIILKDDYLYSNAILPMLLDFPTSKLIAAGVPKGKHKKDGTKHKFYELHEKAMAGASGYKEQNYSSFTNPLLAESDINDLMNEMTEAEARQEIYGEFVEFSGNNPFAHQYDPVKHESREAVFQHGKQITMSFDFNLNPFAVGFSHIWKDGAGYHDHQFDEMEIKNGSVPEMIDRIKSKYAPFLHSAVITGDGMGNRKELTSRDNASVYQQLLSGLNMKETQLRVLGNPEHKNSRDDVNYVLCHHPDFKINPDTCKQTCRDMRSVQCDAFGSIIKRNRNDLNQRADHLDCFVADTPIQTNCGTVPISEIRIGDIVLTRKGYRPVIDKWDSEAEVFEVVFTDGTILECTKDHKFYTYYFGFYPIYSIFTENISAWKLSTTTEGNITNIQSRNITMSAGKERTIQDAYTVKCGSMFMVRYRKICRFITRMVTHLITPLKTLNLLTGENTSEITCNRESKTIHPFSFDCNRQVSRSHHYGTNLKKAWNGIGNTLRKLDSVISPSLNYLANIVAHHSKAGSRMQSFVLMPVSQPAGSQRKKTLYLEPVSFAASRFSTTNTNKRNPVVTNALPPSCLKPVGVKSMTSKGIKKVYDITVDGESEFFANGVLVHNCVRYKIHNCEKDFIRYHQSIKRNSIFLSK